MYISLLLFTSKIQGMDVAYAESYPTTVVVIIVVIDVGTELFPGHDKNPRGFKIFKLASVALHML